MEPQQAATETVLTIVPTILQVADARDAPLHVRADVNKTVITTVPQHVNRIAMDSVTIRVAEVVGI